MRLHIGMPTGTTTVVIPGTTTVMVVRVGRTGIGMVVMMVVVIIWVVPRVVWPITAVIEEWIIPSVIV